MFDKVLRRLPGSQILVALANRFVLSAAVIALGHQYGDLGAQFRQFEGTWKIISQLHMHAGTNISYMRLL
jgi:hypothetical protein